MTALLLAAILALEDTPQKTVEAFVKAFNAHDGAGMSRRVVGQKQGGFPIGPGMPTLTATLGKTTIQGESATVEVDAEMQNNGRSVQKTHETVALRLVGSDWQIVPADPKEDYRMPNRLIASVAYVVTNKDVFLLAKRAAKKTACLSNVKQLAIGTLLYAGDHNDVFPKTSAGWKAAIMPYMKNEGIFHCPDDAPGAVSYFLDPRIAGKSLATLAHAADTAMIVEGTPEKTAFRHDGKCSLGYADGHARIAAPAMVAKARTVSLK